LPKPPTGTSSQLNSFTFVPVPHVTHRYGNLRVVAAEPADNQFYTALPSLQGDTIIVISILVFTFLVPANLGSP